jgi:hypothetical protein
MQLDGTPGNAFKGIKRTAGSHPEKAFPGVPSSGKIAINTQHKLHTKTRSSKERLNSKEN